MPAESLAGILSFSLEYACMDCLVARLYRLKDTTSTFLTQH